MTSEQRKKLEAMAEAGSSGFHPTWFDADAIRAALAEIERLKEVCRQAVEHIDAQGHDEESFDRECLICVARRVLASYVAPCPASAATEQGPE